MLARAATLLNSLKVRPPCIVVLGNENHGKSTLLGRLVGLPLFPRGSGLCTRMVIRVELRRGDATMATVEVVDRSDTAASAVSSTQCTADELEATIKRSMSEALAAHGGSAAVLLTHELRVHIQRPEFPTLDLIDVPGLVTAGNSQSQDTPQQTLALAKSVVESYKDTAMFLVVVDSRTGANVSLAAPLISKELSKRALGVWTKLDVFADENGNDSAALENKLNDDTVELRFGWCACCTPPCVGDCDRIDKEEAERLRAKGFHNHMDKVGLPAIRRLVERYFDEFVIEHWLPPVLGKLKDCLSELAAAHASFGLPSGPRATPAGTRALKALRSVVGCPLTTRIAMELEPVSAAELVKLLEEALNVVQGYAGDRTSLNVPAISNELEKLRAMVAAPAKHVTLNNAGARLEEHNTEAADALVNFAILVGKNVKGPDGRSARMLAALDSHPCKWLQRFPQVKAALASRLDAAVAAAVSDVQARALDLIAANKEKLAEFHVRQANGTTTVVISTAPLVFSLAEQMFEWYITALQQRCGWEALRRLIPSKKKAAWTEVDREASLSKIADAAEVLKYFSDLSVRAAGPGAATGDDRDLLLAAFLGCSHEWARDKPLKEWKGVQVDAAGNAISVDISSCKMTGTPDLSKLPPGLRKLFLSDNQFSGTPDLTKLPVGLLEIHLDRNQFSGAPDLTKLPVGLLDMRLFANQFSGTPDLTKLPQSLMTLFLCGNQFSGTPDLTKLPQSLWNLSLNGNEFSGTPDLTKLPQTLVALYLNDNQFSGIPDLTMLPHALTGLSLYVNQFSGTPDLTKLPRCLTTLCFYANHFSGTPDLTKLPQSLTELYLFANQFSGTPDLTKLPHALTRLNLRENQFSGTPDLSKLQVGLLEIDLSKNRFSGTPDLTNLPGTLTKLFLLENQFSGSPDLTKLPESLVALYLNENQFSGATDLTKLPVGLKYLNISKNQHSFAPDLATLPVGLNKSSVMI